MCVFISFESIYILDKVSKQLTSINLSCLLLPEPGVLRCNGVPLADSGVQKLGVEDCAWTVFRADLLCRGCFLSESEATKAPDCEKPSDHKTG